MLAGMALDSPLRLLMLSETLIVDDRRVATTGAVVDTGTADAGSEKDTSPSRVDSALAFGET